MAVCWRGTPIGFVQRKTDNQWVLTFHFVFLCLNYPDNRGYYAEITFLCFYCFSLAAVRIT